MKSESKKPYLYSSESTAKAPSKDARHLFSVLENYFQSSSGAQDNEIVNATLELLSILIVNVSNDVRITTKKRIEILESIQDIAAFEAERLRPIPLDKAPVLWSQRQDKAASPFEFAHKVYSESIDFMVISDFRKIDKPLADALDKWKRRKGPPSKDFDIPTKRERDNSLIESISWDEIMNEAPERLKRKLRAYRAATARKRRNKKP